MNAFSWTIILTLIVFGVVGLCMGRKIRNGDSFYIMEEKAPTVFLVCGICMSYISAVTMSSGPRICYENGPFFLLVTAQTWAWMGMLVAVLVIGRKMKAIGCKTMPDYFSKRFADNNVICLALLVMVVGMEIYGISQLVTIGDLLSEATGMSYGAVILIMTIALMFFCVPGGTWGIMMTDTIMFLVVLVTAVVVCPVVILHVAPEAVQALPEKFLSVSGVSQHPLYYNVVQSLLWFAFFASSPVIITRVFPAKNDFSVLKAASISVALLAIIAFMIYLTAGLMRGVEPNLPEKDQVMFLAFSTQAPPLLGLIGVAGILTAAISTSSVLFCLAGFSLSRDLYALLNPHRKEESGSVRRARIAQAMTVALGGGIAYLRIGESYDLSIFSCGIFAASWLPVILMSLLWKRFNSAAAFYGMASGALVLTVLHILIYVGKLTLPEMAQYVIAILVCIVVSVVLSLSMPANPENARRYFQIRSAKLSDLVIREARISSASLPCLLKSYRQTRRVMVIVVISSAVILLSLCILFFQFLIP